MTPSYEGPSAYRASCATSEKTGEGRTLGTPRGHVSDEADPGVARRQVADGERLCGDTYNYRASCVARNSCSIAWRRPRLRSAFFADDSLCGLHSKQPARRCLGLPRL